MEIRASNISRTGPLVSSPSGPLPAAPPPVEAPPAAEVRPQADEPEIVTRRLEDMVSDSPLEPFVTGNLQAIADLEKLQAEGKLTPEVLAGLNQLATQPLAPGVDRADLLATALRQMADPSSVNQGDKFTCAPAVVQTMVAQDDPAEYLRLVAGLASPDGTVTLKNGATITRDANWQSDPTRSVIDNLMQPALMQYASGSYDSATDSRRTANGSGQGLYAAEQDKLIEAVTGRKGTSILGSGPEVIGQLSKATAAGQNVPAIIKYQDANGEIKGHAVLVESVKNGKVTYVDPKEGRKTVSLEEFQGKLQSVSLPDEFVTPKLAAAAMNDEEGLLAGGFLRRVRRAFRRVTSGISKAVKSVGNAFKKIGNVVKNAFFKVADFIAPALPFLAVAAWLIPGVGPAIGMALKVAQGVVAAANAVRALESGDILGAVAAGASAFSGVMSGPAAGAAAKWASYANTARNVVNSVKTGNVAGALGAIAGATGNDSLTRAAGIVNTVQNVKNAVENKDFLGAAMSVNGLAIDAKIMDEGQGQEVQRWLERGQAFEQARRSGDVSGLLDLAAQTAGDLGAVAPADYQKALPHLKTGMALYEAAKRGDAQAAVQLGTNALAAAGAIDGRTAQTAQQLSQQVGDISQALAAKDFGSAAKLAAQMGFDAGVLGMIDPEALAKVEEMAGHATHAAKAVRQGDVAGALGAVGAATGNQTIKSAAALANSAQLIQHAVAGKDFLGAAMSINGLAIDAQLIGAGQGKEAQRWLERGQAFEKARRAGDVDAMLDLAAKTAGELGVVTPREYKKALPNLKQGLGLYQAAKRGDLQAALKLEAVSLASKGLLKSKQAMTAATLAEQAAALKEAIAKKDFQKAAKQAARLGYDTGVLGLSDPEALARIEEMAQRAARLNEGFEAARRGEKLKAVKIADQALADGRIQREVEELQEALEARARELANQAKQKVTGR